MSDGFYLAIVNPRTQKFKGPYTNAEDALRAGERYKKDGSSIAVLGAIDPVIRRPRVKVTK